MKLVYCFFVLWGMPVLLAAQSFVFPRFDRPAGSGWSVKDSVLGDLNKDGRADMAVVLEYKDSVRERREDSIVFHRPRVLLIMFQDSLDGSYRVVCQNNTFILREDEGWMDGDPFDGMSVSNGVLIIGFHYSRTTDSYTFRYQKGDFYLIGASAEQHWANAMDRYDVNLSTRKSEHYWTDPDPPHREHDVWNVLKPAPGIRLRDVGVPSSLHIF